MIDRDRKERIVGDLTQLAAIGAPSGHEAPVVRALREAFAPLVDRVEVDAIGNLYAWRSGGDGPHLMVEAHSDEIGAIVAAIEPAGFLRLQTIGGIGEGLLMGRKVRVRDHLGVVGVRPGHLASPEQRRTAPGLEDLYIDLGLTSVEEVCALGIRVGDPITWDSPVERTANPDRVVGKGVDNRTGCAVLLELMRGLQDRRLSGPITAVVAVQEEVGLKGARVAAERVRPDVALVVDTTPCPDTPEGGANTFPVRLGGGAVLQVTSGAAGSGFLLASPMRDFLIGLAERAAIPYQLASFAYGDTDASSIYDAAGGIPTAAITMPRRYSHSPVEMLDLNDALATLRLCEEVALRIEDVPRTFV